MPCKWSLTYPCFAFFFWRWVHPFSINSGRSRDTTCVLLPVFPSHHRASSTKQPGPWHTRVFIIRTFFEHSPRHPSYPYTGKRHGLPRELAAWPRKPLVLWKHIRLDFAPLIASLMVLS